MVLDFYQMDFLCKVHQAKAFFISRLRSGICLFNRVSSFASIS